MDMGRQEAGVPKSSRSAPRKRKGFRERWNKRPKLRWKSLANTLQFHLAMAMDASRVRVTHRAAPERRSRTRHYSFNICRHKRTKMEELFTSVGQEVAMLNRKLSSSKESGVRINDKLELLRKTLQQQLSPVGEQQRARTDETRRKNCQEERDQLVEILMRQLEKSNQTIYRLHQQNALIERCHVTPENVDQRPCQSIQSQHQAQELALVRKEKSQLACQLDAIRSKDKYLRERIGQLEATIHKMSEGFANCQDFIQLKEQEFLRLQLKHILDLTEFQGANETPPGLDSAIPEPDDLGPSKKNHRQNLPGLHVNCDTLRRRSFPERTHRPAFEEAKVTRRQTTCGSNMTDSEWSLFSLNQYKVLLLFDLRLLLQGLHLGLFGSRPMTVKRNTFYTRRPQTSGRGSPVYVLLTSEPEHT
ncbi:uncharacterized protein LOC144196122 isoform X2 [Stigmatopora nigra]